MLYHILNVFKMLDIFVCYSTVVIIVGRVVYNIGNDN